MNCSTQFLSSLCALCALCGELPAAEPGPWSTYRGNAARTGNTDGKPGPDKPTVEWHIASQDHYVAAPVPVGADRVFFSALGAFNRPTISVYPLAGKTAELVKLGIAIGARMEGAAHAHCRRALGTGATPAELRHVALLAAKLTEDRAAGEAILLCPVPHPQPAADYRSGIVVLPEVLPGRRHHNGVAPVSSGSPAPAKTVTQFHAFHA